MKAKVPDGLPVCFVGDHLRVMRSNQGQNDERIPGDIGHSGSTFRCTQAAVERQNATGWSTIDMMGINSIDKWVGEMGLYYSTRNNAYQ